MSVTTPAGEWARTKTLRRTRAVLQNTLLFPGLSSFCRLTVRNREAFGMLQGGAVFVANHCSALDGAVMVEALPPRYRNRSVVVAAADSIFKRKWEAALAEVSVNAFPIPRGGGARPYLETLKGMLRDRWSVVIFPEGRLSVTGAIGTFRKGAAVLAIDAGAPIVPAYIEGMYEVLPRFRRTRRRHRHIRDSADCGRRRGLRHAHGSHRGRPSGPCRGQGIGARHAARDRRQLRRRP